VSQLEKVTELSFPQSSTSLWSMLA
jgi:hypothetical protein